MTGLVLGHGTGSTEKGLEGVICFMNPLLGRRASRAYGADKSTASVLLVHFRSGEACIVLGKRVRQSHSNVAVAEELSLLTFLFLFGVRGAGREQVRLHSRFSR